MRPSHLSADMEEIERTMRREYDYGLSPRELADWTDTPLPRIRKALKQLALEGTVAENDSGYWCLKGTG